MSNFLRRAETFSSHDIFDQMTCSGKVFLIFHDSALGACESVLQKIFPTVPGIHPFNRKYFPRFTASTLNRKGVCIHWRKIKQFSKQIGLPSNFTCVHWKHKHCIFEYVVFLIWRVKMSSLHCTNPFFVRCFHIWNFFWCIFSCVSFSSVPVSYQVF